MMFEFSSTIQWRIQDFQNGEGAHQPLSLGENLLFDKVFAENCMKMKETGTGRGGPRSQAPIGSTNSTRDGSDIQSFSNIQRVFLSSVQLEK